MDNIEKFEEHLREASKDGWHLNQIIKQIENDKCPFDCSLCTYFLNCIVFRNPLVGFERCTVFKDKRDYIGIWKEQRNWYEKLRRKSNLIKIATRIWAEQ